jgi:hypothetical protein
MGGYGPLYEIGKGHIDYPCAECQNCPFVKGCLDTKIPEQADECWAYCEYYGKLLGETNDNQTTATTKPEKTTRTESI